MIVLSVAGVYGTGGAPKKLRQLPQRNPRAIRELLTSFVYCSNYAKFVQEKIFWVRISMFGITHRNECIN